MKDLNKLRMLAGVVIDPSIEITEKKQVNESRNVPTRKRDLTKKDEKSLTQAINGVKSATKHIEQAIKSLEKIPAISVSGDVPLYINELEDLLSGDGSHTGMKHYAENAETELRKLKREENAKRRAEEEEEAASMMAELDEEVVAEAKAKKDYDGDGKVESSEEEHKGVKDKAIKKAKGEENVTEAKKAEKDYDGDGEVESPEDEHKGVRDKAIKKAKNEKAVKEAVHFYKKDYEDYEDDVSKPINVSDGSSNAEQVFDKPMDPDNVKDESPTQLRTGDERSEQDQSDGHDLEAEFKVPPSIKASLKAEIADIKKEADRLDVYNKDSSYFYKDMQRAFEDLLGHLEKGTRYDFKQAQHYTQSLMGPMLHKLPADVWKFITNGGETRSLKDYMKKVKDPITGPRNTIK